MRGILHKIISILLFSIPLSVMAVGFEGSIQMVKESCFDTTYYTYYISDGNIRIEERNNKQVLLNIYLVNTDSNEVIVVNPGKKLYTRLQKKTVLAPGSDNFEIIKTANSKDVNGLKCIQWRVRNRNMNTEISYWVAQSDFYFFERLVKVLNSTERSWEYFTHIPGSKGFFPMLSVERNLVRDEKMRTRVVDISRKDIDHSMFKIPSGYKLFAMQ